LGFEDNLHSRWPAASVNESKRQVQEVVCSDHERAEAIVQVRISVSGCHIIQGISRHVMSANIQYQECWYRNNAKTM
jgi:hypothetical protein